MRWILYIIALGLPVIADASATPARVTRIVGLDTSRSMRGVFSELRFAAIDLVRTTPDGSTLVILDVGTVTVPVFETSSVGPQSRAAAVDRLTRLEPVAAFTDLGLALSTASGLSAVAPGGTREMYLLTDGQPRTRERTRFAGRSFDALLSDRAVVRDDMRVYVVTPRPSTAQPARSNVRFVTPRELPKGPRLPIRPAAALLPPQDPSLLGWTLSAAILVTLVLVAGGGAFLAWKQRERARADALAAMAALPDDPRSDGKQAPSAVSVPGFLIRTDAGDVELHADHPEVEIGGGWNAAVYLEAASAASAKLRVTPQERLEVRNTGPCEVHVGALRVPPGGTQLLPRGPVRMRLGAADVLVTPSQVTMREELADANG